MKAASAKNRAIGLAAAGGIALAALIAWRVSLGGIGFYDASQVLNPCLEVPPGGEHRAKPGCEGLSRVGTQEATLRFNRLGLRDHDYPAKPAHGTTRVLVLGSSNTLGLGTEEAQTFPRRLEAELRALGVRAEVINGATVGYCTTQTALRLRELLGAYSPSLVIYHFVAGTCPLFDGAWESRVQFEQGRPVRIDRTPFPAGPDWLNQALFLQPGAFFLWLTAADQARKAVFSWRVALARGEEAKAAAVLAPTLQQLSYMKAEVERSGARFALASYQMRSFAQPVPAQFHVGFARLLSWLMIPWEIPVQSLFRELRASGFELFVPDFLKNQFLVPGDLHFTAEGYRDYAAKLAAALAPTLPRGRK